MCVQAGSGSMSATNGDEPAASPTAPRAATAEPNPAVSAPTGPQKVTPHPEPLPCQTCAFVSEMVHVLA